MYARERQHKVTMRVFIPMLLVAAMLLSCSQQADTIEPVVPLPPAEPEPMSLAFACASSSHAQTRQTSDIVQNEAQYRAISDFHFIALKKDGNQTIEAASNFSVNHQLLPEDKPTGRYYHFGYCDISQGMNGCLVYAKAVDDEPKATPEETAAYYGILNESFPNYVYSTDQIYFEPVSIYGDEETIPAGAMTLADALTDIANTQAIGAYWSTINSPDLRSLFSHFTNYGYDLPGSAASVREWIKALNEAASSLSFGDGTTDQALCEQIIAKTTAYLNPEYEHTLVGLTYPQDINLPDGAAALRWTDVEENDVMVKKFVPQLHTTTLDDINSVSRFVYPPALYYRVESDIWTSNNKVTFDQYKSRNSWAGAGDGAVQSLFTDGGTIGPNTKTIAVQNPLQYAVAQLQLRVKVDDNNSGSQLRYDAQGHTIAYTDGTNHYFRLTGVIVGGQRKVGYDFKPITLSDVDMRFIYDSQVPPNFWLKMNSTDEVNTLVLQSYDHEDLNVILEFEYTGALEFKCLNGYVYPNTRFYLVGELKADAFTSGSDENNQDRIFTQDYTTSIQMTVKSLEKAYNVLPSIISKNLEIGVMTTPMWKAAEPSDPVIMD